LLVREGTKEKGRGLRIQPAERNTRVRRGETKGGASAKAGAEKLLRPAKKKRKVGRARTTGNVLLELLGRGS